MIEIKNAKISSTSLMIEDHGILSFWLMLDYAGGGQGFGGYSLDGPVKKEGKFITREGTAWGMELLRRILTTLEVDSWERLPGTPLRVKADHGKVHAIGHYLKDKWLDPNDLAHLLEKND